MVWSALEALAHLVDRGNARVVGIAVQHLGAEERRVRAVAAEVLQKVAEVGDAHVIAALLEVLRDDEPHVRKVAAQVVGTLAQKGDTDILVALANCLPDKSLHVQQEIAAAFVRLADRGNNKARSAVETHLRNAGASVQRLAVEMFVEVAEKDDEQAVATLKERTEANSWKVRVAVVRGLPRVSTSCIKPIESLLRGCLDDRNERVRNAAADVLAGEKIKATFHLCDVSGNGVLTRDELAQLLRKLELPDEDVDGTLHAVDNNKDGVVDFNEFVHWMLQQT